MLGEMQMLGERDCGRLWTLFSDNFRLFGEGGMIGGELKVRKKMSDVCEKRRYGTIKSLLSSMRGHLRFMTMNVRSLGSIAKLIRVQA